ncbi:Energy-coupling factor transporter transmembrane protein EcfT [Sporomusa sphaeroides DSM 2875]|uniref:Energy-coupling factor transporter transmembrane protein EcfT n=2 Tax=Sporomusa TaxID=2375 RepID=A0ABP2C8B3_9FIRM|nr:energy-coupling factor transporter transmembrane component T [Sporomusa sphaeroides]OLS57250.1 energy-coupling factor transporter transmembrane protein EcfT [Sporomusa sphaeroides DSM 2875]CVK20152.1 Energy-coupling factor transporter transmembrane protein EcfT [Sporomusa sphaeroides DSM 2875]
MHVEMSSNAGSVSLTSPTNTNNVFKLDKKNGLKDIDPRVKIIITLAFSTMLFCTAQELTILISLLMVFVIFLFSCMAKKSIKFIVAYIIIVVFNYVINLISIESLTVLLSAITYTMLKFIPMVMLSYWLFSTVRVNELIVALEQMKIPKSMILSLAVLFRFLPTVTEELGYIRDTMKMRNIDLSFKRVILQPVKTTEYIMIPLLLRSVKISDELATAALTRGIDGENKRTSLRKLYISFPEILFAVLFILFTAFLYQFDRQIIEFPIMR